MQPRFISSFLKRNGLQIRKLRSSITKIICLSYISVENRSKVSLSTIVSTLWIQETFNLLVKNKSSNVWAMIFQITLSKATMHAFLLMDKQVIGNTAFIKFGAIHKLQGMSPLTVIYNIQNTQIWVITQGFFSYFIITGK